MIRDTIVFAMLPLMIGAAGRPALAGRATHALDGNAATRAPGARGERGASREFGWVTSEGWLAGTLDDRSRAVLTLPGTGARAVVDFPSEDGTDRIRVAYPHRDAEVILERRAGGGFRLVRSRGLDCPAIEQDALLRAGTDALRRLSRGDAAAGDSAGLDAETVSALLLATTLPAAATGCALPAGPRPDAGACNLDNPAFGSCMRCCSDKAEALGALCRIGYAVGCRNNLCRLLGEGLCGGLREVAELTCGGRNCSGKQGDPECMDPPACTGLCMEFCGPGWRSQCGACPLGKVCCS